MKKDGKCKINTYNDDKVEIVERKVKKLKKK